MTTSFLMQNVLAELGPAEICEPETSSPGDACSFASADMPPRAEKFQIPDIGHIFDRKRLLDLVALSVERYGATLISGRAGTGKTVLAADFARRQPKSVWYAIDASDAAWPEFSGSLARCLGS